MAKKTLRVSLDTSLNPAVRVDPVAYGKSKMRWKPEKGSNNFIFEGIQFLKSAGNPFEIKEVTNDKIKVDNEKSSGDWEYILTVKDKQGNSHTSTTMGGPPTGGKPVIRN